MVARIKIGSSLSRVFFYNEHKVKEGLAECIAAENYPFALERMGQSRKLDVLQKTASLRERLKANAVHISLNFAPSEQPGNERLKEIARRYMEKIGFGKQPFLVYRHDDAGHAHIHIVTTKVDMAGRPINTNNIGKEHSEPARKEIETEFGLVKAEDMKQNDYQLKPAYAKRVEYGKTESKKAISIVLNEVLTNYKFTSLAELNAVLNRYNVTADKGSEDSRTFKNKGLHYKIIDEEGRPVGVPIKASLFHQKPTLKFLEERFALNEKTRQPFKSRLKSAIDFYFLGNKKPSTDGLIAALKKGGIDIVLRRSEQGQVYGLTYIDHRAKCVFNGSNLGKTYSAKGVLERCAITTGEQKEGLPAREIKMDQSGLPISPETVPATGHNESLLDILMQSEQEAGSLPYELSGKKKKRKKRKLR